jgi:dCTP deaminase
VILPDFEIELLCKEYALATPYDPALINPASLDVRLGPTLMVEVSCAALSPATPSATPPSSAALSGAAELSAAQPGPLLQTLSIADTSPESPYLLAPGAFTLAHTIEIFNIPEDVCARFMLKSSRAREGLNHLLAGFADPGFNGSSMTLELKNELQHHHIPLWHGMRIGQMVFELMAAKPKRSYAVSGRYNNIVSVSGSKG